MGRKIVVLSSSPRKGETTDRLTGAFLEGAEAAGHSVSCFRVADLKIGGCLACFHCTREAGACVQKDDMQPVLEKLKTADALVLASPVYFFSVNAQLKLAVDRMFALLTTGTPIKRVALLITCGDKSEEAAAPSVDMFRQIAAYNKWEEAGAIVAAGLHDAGDLDGRMELVSAKKLGQNI